ncbi:MAG: hypothetical protein VX453_06105, partial [Acidobacteriota bacterium]|nr:hypothetical protein [Acidobacteriota bacterium]
MRCTAKVVGVGLGVLAVCGPLPVGAQVTSDPTVRTVAVQVEETAGIRRNFYPVNVRVPFAQSELEHSDQVRLVAVADNVELAVQVTVASRWPDGSIQWLQVDSNVSLGPEET